MNDHFESQVHPTSESRYLYSSFLYIRQLSTNSKHICIEIHLSTMNSLKLTRRTFHFGKALKKSKIQSRYILKDAKSQKVLNPLLSRRTLTTSCHTLSIKSNDVNLSTNTVTEGLLQQHNTSIIDDDRLNEHHESNNKYAYVPTWRNGQLFFMFALGSLIGTMCLMKKRQLKAQGSPSPV